VDVNGGQGTKWRRKIAEDFKLLNGVHERRYRQTDDRRTGNDINSERERERKLAKNRCTWRSIYGNVNDVTTTC